MHLRSSRSFRVALLAPSLLVTLFGTSCGGSDDASGSGPSSGGGGSGSLGGEGTHQLARPSQDSGGVEARGPGGASGTEATPWAGTAGAADTTAGAGTTGANRSGAGGLAGAPPGTVTATGQAGASGAITVAAAGMASVTGSGGGSSAGAPSASSGGHGPLAGAGGVDHAGAQAGAWGKGDPERGGAGGITDGGAGSTGTLLGEPCVGYTLISIPEVDAGPDFTAMLIDMAGTTVHRWTITGSPAKMLPGGSLIGCVGVTAGSYDCEHLQQVSWDGELEWSFRDWFVQPNGIAVARHHHDFEREGNPVGYYAPGQEFALGGRTLVLAHLEKTVPEIRDAPLDDDVIYEVDGSGALTGFEWHAADHFEELGFDDAAREDIRTRLGDGRLEWLHGNSLSELGDNHWYYSGYEEFHPENFIYSSRQASLVLIISRQTGRVVWRLGPVFEGRPEEAIGQFAGQHHAHMIPRGLPGEGNILVFDNGGSSGYGTTFARDYSRVVEIDPVTFEVVWEYGEGAGEHFFSPYVSSAQRLPNGNTLITSGLERHLFEVTPDKNIVWEYVYEPENSDYANWVYRSYRIPPEWLPDGENEALASYPTWRSRFE